MKMHNNNRIFNILVAICMSIIFVIPCQEKIEAADNGGNFENVTWSVSGTTLTITGKGKMPDCDSSNRAPWLNQDVEKIVIGNGITYVGRQNFVQMSSVTSVSFPNTLETVGEAAFYGCSQLSSVSLPAKVNTIESGAFAECSNLSSFSAAGATEINEYALQATSLSIFEIPKGVTDFSPLILYGNYKLQKYTVASGNKAYVSENGVVYNYSKNELVAYPRVCTSRKFSVPSGVKKIGSYAFYGVTNLDSVDFANVTTLEEGAFFKSSLKGNLVLSDKITNVGNFTFEQSNNITSVKFGKNLKQTSYRMFEECDGIKTIDFGGLKELEMRTFLGCDSLTEVTLPGSMTQWGGSVFNSCSNLVTFNSKGLKEITYADFAQCYSLKNVNLSSVQKIYRQAFTYCNSLTSITLPATIQWVDAEAFEQSVKVTCRNKNLVKFGKNGLQYAEKITISGTRDYKKAFEVLSIVNKKRKENGLSALTMDTGLLETAMKRAGEQTVLFSHTRPDGSSCFTANTYMIAENVAIGQTTSAKVMESWMNSDGHRANILMKNAQTIGVGCFYSNGVYTWVQCFGDTKAEKTAAKPANKTVRQSMNIPRYKFNEAANTTGIIWGTVQEYTYKLRLNTTKKTYQAGQSTQARLQLINPGFDNAVNFASDNISWSSSNTSVARVDSKGKITFVGGGNVTITGKTKYYKASVKLNVTKKSNPISIRTNSKKFRVNAVTKRISGRRTFDIGIRNAKGKVTYTMASKTRRYITVRNGRVTVKKGTPRGTYNITVKAAGDRMYKSQTRRVTVKVY